MPKVGIEKYITITPERLAVECMTRVATELDDAMHRNSMRWWFVITDVEQAITSALVAALSGTAEIGALKEEDQIAWLTFFEESRTDKNARPPAKQKLATLRELIARAKDPKNMDLMGPPLSLDEKQESDIMRIHEFRNDLLHVKPVSWSMEIAGLPRMIGAAIEVIQKLFDLPRFRLHLEEKDFERMETSLKSIEKTFQRMQK
jgi:hypothetical protein